MPNPPTHGELKAKQRDIRDGFPETMGLRVHRSISWIRRAELAEDDDAKFVFLWIAFNAAYADEKKRRRHVRSGFKSDPEKSLFADFFGQVVKLDDQGRIYEAIRNQFHDSIHSLIANKFVYNPFWQHQNGMADFGNWKSQFADSKRRFKFDFDSRKTVVVLGALFDRLYVLRNQIMHGGSTWDSRVNRAQVRDGAAILGFLIPVLVDLMMDHPHENWGVPFYQVIEE